MGRRGSSADDGGPAPPRSWGTDGFFSLSPGDRLLLRLLRRVRLPVLFLWLTALALAAAELALPALLGRALDVVLHRGSMLGWPLAAVAVIVGLVAVDVTDDLVVGAVTASSTATLRRWFLRSLLATTPERVSAYSAGDLAARASANSADAGRFPPVAIRAVANLVPSVGAVVALGIIDVRLCLVFLLGMPPLLIVVRRFSLDVTSVTRDYLQEQGRIAGRLLDAVHGRRTIAASGTQRRECDRVLASLPVLHGHGRRMWEAQRRVTVRNAVLLSVLEVLVLAVAGVELAAGRLTPGGLLAAAQYVVLATGLGAAVGFVAQRARGSAAAGRVAEVLALPAVSYGEAPPAAAGRVQLRGVRVRRDGRPVLQVRDLDVPAGSFVAVVGRSGSGKSLLAALVARLVLPDEGCVLVDGTDVAGMSAEALRRTVAYGFDRPVLFGETVADAIRAGRPDLDRPAVDAALRSARADFVFRMPEGPDTALQEVPLSGGELQRLGLARAFCRQARVLVLDDVSSSLDAVTDHEVTQVVTRESQGSTRIVVAHRASTAAAADAVVWMDRGRVRAVAPHEQLLRDAGYRAVFAGGAAPAPGRRPARSPA